MDPRARIKEIYFSIMRAEHKTKRSGNPLLFLEK
jgi:hypothetical protein